MIIKLFLIAGLTAAAMFAYRTPLSSRSMALRRLTGLFLLLAGTAAVLKPDAVSTVANAVGVGRGTDLVLYVLVVVSLFTWLGLYRRIHALEDRITALTRHVAKHSVRGPVPTPPTAQSRAQRDNA